MFLARFLLALLFHTNFDYLMGQEEDWKTPKEDEVDPASNPHTQADGDTP